MNRMLSVYAPFSPDSSALRVVKEKTVTIKIKAKRNITLKISVNCFLVMVRDL
jgi:hypothetical protein